MRIYTCTYVCSVVSTLLRWKIDWSSNSWLNPLCNSGSKLKRLNKQMSRKANEMKNKRVSKYCRNQLTNASKHRSSATPHNRRGRLWADKCSSKQQRQETVTTTILVLLAKKANYTIYYKRKLMMLAFMYGCVCVCTLALPSVIRW